MNQAHHEQLALDLLANIRAYRGQLSPKVEAAIRLLEKNQDLFMRSCSQADRLADTSLKMVWFLPDKTSVAGHNLSSFQHFATTVPYQRANGSGWRRAGYCWDRDSSLGWLDKLVDFSVKLLHSKIEARTDDAWFHPEVLSHTPMAQYVQQSVAKFNAFEFPSAIEVAHYYSWVAANAQTDEEWIKCVGIVLHMLVDLCVPHHVRGWLLKGHQNWEDAADALWTKWKGGVAVYSRLGWLDRRTSKFNPKQQILSLASGAGAETSAWLNEPRNHQMATAGKLDTQCAVNIGHMALDFTIKAVEIMAEQRQQSYA